MGKRSEPTTSVAGCPAQTVSDELEPSLEGLRQAACEVARQRRDILSRLRASVEAGDKEMAFEIAKELCGLDHEKKGPRTDSRIH